MGDADDELWLTCCGCGCDWPEDEINGEGRCPDCEREEDEYA